MQAAPGLPEYGPIILIALISLLSFKGIFSGSKFWGKSLESSLKMGIVPLVLSFGAIFVFKIAALF